MSKLKGKSVFSRIASSRIRLDHKIIKEDRKIIQKDRKIIQEDYAGEAGLKMIVSDLKIRQVYLEPLVKEQAAAKSKKGWLFDLVAKLKNSRELIRVELPDLFHDELEMLSDQIRLLEKLMHTLKVLEFGLGIRILEKEIELDLSGLAYNFYFIMTSCDQLNEKLTDGDSKKFGAIHMAYNLFHALDQLDGFFSGLGSRLQTVGITLKPVQGQASAKKETKWIFDLIIKLKKAEKHIRKESILENGDRVEKLVEFISKLENSEVEHELKVKLKENEKLCQGLESEFSSMMTLCDQLNEKFEHLYDPMTADERSWYEDYSDNIDGLVFVRSYDVNKIADSLFEALDKLDKRCSRLVSPWRTVGNRGKGLLTPDIVKEKDYYKNDVPTPTVAKEKKVIEIKSNDILVEELKMALSSKIPVVMLFNANSVEPSKEYLPNFYDLPKQYHNFNGDIKFLRVDVVQAAKEFNVRAYPTVLVLVPRRYGLMVARRLSIEETVIVPAFVTVLKSRLNKCLWQYCGYKREHWDKVK